VCRSVFKTGSMRISEYRKAAVPGGPTVQASPPGTGAFADIRRPPIWCAEGLSDGVDTLDDMAVRWPNSVRSLATAEASRDGVIGRQLVDS
jgi:hypothetical protein